MRKLKRLFSIIILSSLMLGNVSAAVTSESISDLKNQQYGVQNQMQKAKDYLEDTQTQKSQVMQEVLQLDIQLDEAEQELDFINGELERITALLEQTETDLTEAELSKETQYEVLKSRIQYMHENGSVSYIEILLQSSSFTDFLNRIEYIDSIISYDNNMVAKLKETEDFIIQKLDDITTQKNDIETLQSRQAAKKLLLEEAISAKDAVILQLTQDESSFNQQVKDLEQSSQQIQQLIKEAEEAEAARIAAEKAAKEKAEREAAEKAAKEKAEREAAEKAAAEKAAAEKAAAEKAAAEKAAAEKAAAKSSQTAYVGGKLSWPVPGYYERSSEYGNRINPISGKKEFHTGIDIPAPKGSNIASAGAGTVIFSGYKGGYGYTVIVDHGGGITTLYGHNSKLLVEAGDKVSKGETIAKCGSTGYSTGPHCHFEVRENGSHVAPLSYLQ